MTNQRMFAESLFALLAVTALAASADGTLAFGANYGTGPSQGSTNPMSRPRAVTVAGDSPVAAVDLKSLRVTGHLSTGYGAGAKYSDSMAWEDRR